MSYDQLIESAFNEVEKASSTEEIENVRIKFFGKNGLVTKELKSLISLSSEERKKFGNELNTFK